MMSSTCNKKVPLKYSDSFVGGGTQPPLSAGFTLVELMVSLSIFSILMVVSVGTLLTLIDVNAKAQALSSATTNLSFALDSMTREIRTGHAYYCHNNSNSDTLPSDSSMPNDCPPGSGVQNDFIAFIRDRDGYKIGYRRVVDEGRGVIEQRIEDTNATDGVDLEMAWSPITSQDVSVDEFLIVVDDSRTQESNGNVEQAFVTLYIKGHVTNGLDTDTDFSIQTLIVQRRLDQV